MLISWELLKVLFVVTLFSFALWMLFMPWGLKAGSEFKEATSLVALGSPSVPILVQTSDEVGRKQKAIAEFQDMERMYELRRAEIERALTGFSVLRALRVAAPQFPERTIVNPSSVLRSAIVLGDSLAGAGLTPGSAMYWMELSGGLLTEAIARDESILRDLAGGAARTIRCGSADVTLSLESATIEDHRPNGIGTIRLEIGAPILLRLDEYSERVMREALDDRAPPPGLSSKVRLFGGFRISADRKRLQVLPLRQEPDMKSPEEGRLHDVSGLLGVVIAESAHRAFRWERPIKAYAMAPVALH